MTPCLRYVHRTWCRFAPRPKAQHAHHVSCTYWSSNWRLDRIKSAGMCVPTSGSDVMNMPFMPEVGTHLARAVLIDLCWSYTPCACACVWIPSPLDLGGCRGKHAGQTASCPLPNPENSACVCAYICAPAGAPRLITALHVASYHNQEDMVQLLLDKGIKVGLRGSVELWVRFCTVNRTENNVGLRGCRRWRTRGCRKVGDSVQNPRFCRVVLSVGFATCACQCESQLLLYQGPRCVSGLLPLLL